MAEGRIDLIQQIHARIFSRESEKAEAPSHNESLRRDEGAILSSRVPDEIPSPSARRISTSGQEGEEELKAHQGDRVYLGGGRGYGQEISDKLPRSPRSSGSGYLGRMFRLWDLLLREWSHFSGPDQEEQTSGWEASGYDETLVSRRHTALIDPTVPLNDGSFVFQALKEKQETQKPMNPRASSETQPLQNESSCDPLSFIDDFSSEERIRLEILVQALTDEQLHVMVNWMAHPRSSGDVKGDTDAKEFPAIRKELLNGIEKLLSVVDPTIGVHTFALMNESAEMERAPLAGKLYDSLNGLEGEAQQHLVEFLMELPPGERTEILEVISGREASLSRSERQRLIESLASLSESELEATLSFMRNSEFYKESSVHNKSDALRLAILAQGIQADTDISGNGSRPEKSDPEGTVKSAFDLTENKERDRRRILSMLESTNPATVQETIDFIRDPEGKSLGNESFARNPAERRDEIISEIYGRLIIKDALSSTERTVTPDGGKSRALTSFWADLTRKMRNRISPGFVNSTLRQISSLRFEEGGTPRYDVKNREMTVPGSYAGNPEGGSATDNARIVHELFHAAFWTTISPDESVSKDTMAFASKVTDLYRRTDENGQTKERFFTSLEARYRVLGFQDKEIDMIKNKVSHNAGELISHIATLIMAKDDKGKNGIEATDPKGKKYLLEGLPPGSITLIHEWMGKKLATKGGDLSTMTGQELHTLKNRFVRVSDMFRRSRGADVRGIAAKKASEPPLAEEATKSSHGVVKQDSESARQISAGMSSEKGVTSGEELMQPGEISRQVSVGETAAEGTQSLPASEPALVESMTISSEPVMEESPETPFSQLENAFTGLLAKERKRFKRVMQWLTDDRHSNFFSLFDGISPTEKKEMFKSFTDSINGLKSKDQKELVRLISSPSLQPADRKEILDVTAGLRNTKKNPERQEFIGRCALLSQQQLSDLSSYLRVSPLYAEQKSAEGRADFINCTSLLQHEERLLTPSEVNRRDELIGSFFDTALQGRYDRKALLALMVRLPQQFREQTLSFIAKPDEESYGTIPPSSSRDTREQEILAEAYLRFRMGEATVEGSKGASSSEVAPLIREIVDVTRLSRDDVSSDFLLSTVRSMEEIAFQPVMTPHYDGSTGVMTLPSRYLEEGQKSDTEAPDTRMDMLNHPEMVKAFIEPSLHERLKEMMFHQYRVLQISQDGIQRLNGAWRWCTENLRNGDGAEESAVKSGDEEAQIISQVAYVLMHLNVIGNTADQAAADEEGQRMLQGDMADFASSSVTSPEGQGEEGIAPVSESRTGKLAEAKKWLLSTLPGDMVRLIRYGTLRSEDKSEALYAENRRSTGEPKPGLLRSRFETKTAGHENYPSTRHGELKASKDPDGSEKKHDNVVRLRGQQKPELQSDLLKNELLPSIQQSTAKLLERISTTPPFKAELLMPDAGLSLQIPISQKTEYDSSDSASHTLSSPEPAAAPSPLSGAAASDGEAVRKSPDSVNNEIEANRAEYLSYLESGTSSKKNREAMKAGSEETRTPALKRQESSLQPPTVDSAAQMFPASLSPIEATAVRKAAAPSQTETPVVQRLAAPSPSEANAMPELKKEPEKYELSSFKWFASLSLKDRESMNGLVGGLTGKDRDRFLKNLESISPEGISSSLSFTRESSFYEDIVIPGEKTDAFLLASVPAKSDTDNSLSSARRDELVKSTLDLTFSSTLDRNNLLGLMLNGRPDVSLRTMEFIHNPSEKTDGRSEYADNNEDRKREIAAESYVKLQLGNALYSSGDRSVQMPDSQKDALTGKIVDLFRGKKETVSTQFVLNCLREVKSINVRDGALTSFDVNSRELTVSRDFLTNMDRMNEKEKSKVVHEFMHVAFRATLDKEQTSSDTSFAFVSKVTGLHRKIQEDTEVRGMFMTGLEGLYRKLGYEDKEIEGIKKSCLTSAEDLTAHMGFMVMADRVAKEKQRVSTQSQSSQSGTLLKEKQKTVTPVPASIGEMLPRGAGDFFSSWIGGKLAADDEVTAQAAKKASRKIPWNAIGSSILGTGVTSILSFMVKKGAEALGGVVSSPSSTTTAASGSLPAAGALPVTGAPSATGTSTTPLTTAEKESAAKYLSLFVDRARSIWGYSVDSYQDSAWYKGLNGDQKTLVSSIKKDMGLYGMKDLDEQLKGMDADSVNNFFAIVGKEEDRNKYRSKLAWRLAAMTRNMKPEEAKSTLTSLSKLDNDDIKNFDMTFNGILNSRANHGVQDDAKVKVAAQFTSRLSEMTPAQQKELLGVTSRLPAGSKVKFLEMFNSLKPEEMQTLCSYMQDSSYYQSIGKDKSEDPASRKATVLMLSVTAADRNAMGSKGGRKAELDRVDRVVQESMNVFTRDPQNFSKYGMDLLKRLRESNDPDHARKTLESIGRNIDVTDAFSQRRAMAFAGLQISLLDSGVSEGEAANTTWGLMSNYFDNQPNNSIESILKTKKIEFKEGEGVGPSFDTNTGVMVLPSVMETKIEGFDRLVASHESDHAAQAALGDKDNPESNNFMAVLMGMPQDLYRDYRNNPEKMNNALIAYYRKMAEDDPGQRDKAMEKVQLLTDNLRGKDGKSDVVMSFDELNAHLRTITKQSEHGQSDSEKTAARQALAALGLDDRQQSFYSRWVNGNLPENSAILEALARTKYQKPVADFTRGSDSLYTYLSSPDHATEFEQFKNAAASRLKEMGFNEQQVNDKLRCGSASSFASLYNEVAFNKDKKGVAGLQNEAFVTMLKGISPEVSSSVDSIRNLVKEGFDSQYDNAFTFIRERGSVEKDTRLLQDYGISRENIKAYCDKADMKYDDFEGQISRLSDVMVHRHKAGAQVRVSDDREGALCGYTDARDDVSAAASAIMNNMLTSYNRKGVEDNWVTQGQCYFTGQNQGQTWWFPLGGGTKPVIDPSGGTGQGTAGTPGTQMKPQPGTQVPVTLQPDGKINIQVRSEGPMISGTSITGGVQPSVIRPPVQETAIPSAPGGIKTPSASGGTGGGPVTLQPPALQPSTQTQTTTVTPGALNTGVTTVSPVNNPVITNPAIKPGPVTEPVTKPDLSGYIPGDETELTDEARKAALEEKAKNEAEAMKKADEEAARKADEAKKLQEDIRKKETEARKLEEEARKKTEEARKHEEEASVKEAETEKAQEDERKKSADETEKKDTETRKKAEEGLKTELERKKLSEEKNAGDTAGQSIERDRITKEEEAKKQEHIVKKESEPKKDEILKLKNEAETLKGQAENLKKEAVTQKEELFSLLEQMDRLQGKHKQVAEEILKDVKPQLGNTASEVAASLSEMIEAGAFSSHNAKESLKTFLSLLGRSDGPDHAAEFLARSCTTLTGSRNLVRFLQTASRDPEGGAMTARFLEVSSSTREGCMSLARMMRNISMSSDEMKDFLNVLNMAHAHPEGAESLVRAFSNLITVPGGGETFSAFIANASSTGQNARMLSQMFASMAGTREGAQQMANLLGQLTTLSPESQENLFYSFRQMSSTQEGAHFLSQAMASTAMDSGGAKVMARLLQGSTQSGEGMRNLQSSLLNMSSSPDSATNSALFLERASSTREGAEALVKTFENFTHSKDGADTSHMARAFSNVSYAAEGSMALAKAFRSLCRVNDGIEIFAQFIKSSSASQEGGVHVSRMFARIAAAPEGGRLLAELLVKLSTNSKASQESLLESFRNMSLSAEGAKNLGRAMAGTSMVPEGARAASRLIQMASSTKEGCTTLFSALRNMTSSSEGSHAAAMFLKSAAADAAGAESLGKAFSNLTSGAAGTRDMLGFFARMTVSRDSAALFSSALDSMSNSKGNDEHLMAFIAGASNEERDGRALSIVMNRISSTEEGASNLNRLMTRLTSSDGQRQTFVESFVKLSGTKEGAKMLGGVFTALLSQPHGGASLEKILQLAGRSAEGTDLFLKAFSESVDMTVTGSAAFISLLSRVDVPLELARFLTHTASKDEQIERFSVMMKDASREEGNRGKLGQLMQKASATPEGAAALLKIISREMQSHDGTFRMTSLLNDISQSNEGALPLARVLQNISGTAEGRETLSQFIQKATKSTEGSRDMNQMLACISFSKDGARALSDVLAKLSSHSPEVRQNLLQSFTKMVASEEGAEFLSHAMAHTSSVKEGAGMMTTLIEAASKTPSGVSSLFQSMKNMSASADGARNMSVFLGRGSSSEEGAHALAQALGSMVSTPQGAANMASLLSNSSCSLEGSTVLSRSMLNMANSKGGGEVIFSLMKSAVLSEKGAFDLASAIKQMASTSEGALDLSKMIVQLSRTPKGSNELLQSFSKLALPEEGSQLMTSAFTTMAASPAGLKNLSHFITQSLSSPENARQLLSFFGKMAPSSEGIRGMMLTAMAGKPEGGSRAATLLALSSHSPELLNEFLSFIAGAACDSESSGRVAQFLQAGSSSREGVWSTLKLMDSVSSKPESLNDFTKVLSTVSGGRGGGLAIAKVLGNLGAVPEGLEQLIGFFMNASATPEGGRETGQLFFNLVETAEGSKIFADLVQKATTQSIALRDNMIRTFRNITSGAEGAELFGKTVADLSGSNQGMKAMLGLISKAMTAPDGSHAFFPSFRSMTSTIDGAGSMAVFFEHAAFSPEGARTVGELFRKSFREAGGTQDMASFSARATSRKEGAMLLTRTLLNLSAMNEHSDLLPTFVKNASKDQESSHNLATMLSNMTETRECREGLSRLFGGMTEKEDGSRSLLGSLAQISSSIDDARLLSKALLNISQTPEGERVLTRMVQSASFEDQSSQSLFSLIRNMASTPEGSTCAALLLQKGAQAYKGSSALATALNELSSHQDKAQDVASLFLKLSSTSEGATALSRSLLIMTGAEGHEKLMGSFIDRFSQSPRALLDFSQSMMRMTSTFEGAHAMSQIMNELISQPNGLPSMQKLCEGLTESSEGSRSLGAAFAEMASTPQGRVALSEFLLQSSRSREGMSMLVSTLFRMNESPGGALSLAELFERVSSSPESGEKLAVALGELTAGDDGIKMLSKLFVKCSESVEGGALLAKTLLNLNDTKSGSESLASLLRNASDGRETGALIARGFAQISAGEEGAQYLSRLLSNTRKTSRNEAMTLNAFVSMAQSDEGAVSLSRALLNISRNDEGSQSLGSLLSRMTSTREGASSFMMLLPTLQASSDGAKNMAHFFLRSASTLPGAGYIAELITNLCSSGEGAQQFIQLLTRNQGVPIALKAYAETLAELSATPRGSEAIATMIRSALSTPDGAGEFTKLLSTLSNTPDGSISLSRFMSSFTARAEHASLLTETYSQAARTGEGMKDLAMLAEHASSTPEGSRELAKALDNLTGNEKGSRDMAGLLRQISSSNEGVKGLGRTLVNISYSPETSRDLLAVLQRCCSTQEGSFRIGEVIRNLVDSRDGAENMALFLQSRASVTENGFEPMQQFLHNVASSKQGAESLALMLDRISSTQFGVKSLSNTMSKMVENGEGATELSILFEKITSSGEGSMHFTRMLAAVSNREERTQWAGILGEMSRNPENIDSLSHFISNMSKTEESRFTLMDFFIKASFKYEGARNCARLFDQASTNPQLKQDLEKLLGRVSETSDGSNKVSRLLENIDRGRRERVLTGTRSSESAAVLRGEEARAKLRSDIDVSIFQRPILTRRGAELEREERLIMTQGLEADTRKAEMGLERTLRLSPAEKALSTSMMGERGIAFRQIATGVPYDTAALAAAQNSMQGGATAAAERHINAVAGMDVISEYEEDETGNVETGSKGEKSGEMKRNLPFRPIDIYPESILRYFSICIECGNKCASRQVLCARCEARYERQIRMLSGVSVSRAGHYFSTQTDVVEVSPAISDAFNREDMMPGEVLSLRMPQKFPKYIEFLALAHSHQ